MKLPLGARDRPRLGLAAFTRRILLRGVFALPDGLLFLGDLATFLSAAESESLARAEALAAAHSRLSS